MKWSKYGQLKQENRMDSNLFYDLVNETSFFTMSMAPWKQKIRANKVNHKVFLMCHFGWGSGEECRKGVITWRKENWSQNCPFKTLWVYRHAYKIMRTHIQINKCRNTSQKKWHEGEISNYLFKYQTKNWKSGWFW